MTSTTVEVVVLPMREKRRVLVVERVDRLAPHVSGRAGDRDSDHIPGCAPVRSIGHLEPPVGPLGREPSPGYDRGCPGPRVRAVDTGPRGAVRATTKTF